MDWIVFRQSFTLNLLSIRDVNECANTDYTFDDIVRKKLHEIDFLSIILFPRNFHIKSFVFPRDTENGK